MPSQPALTWSHFAEALQGAREKVSPLQFQMLQAHFLAHERTISATDLALAVGSTSFQVVNSQYGRLGTLLRRVSSPLQRLPGQRSHALASFLPPDSSHPHWRLRMHASLATAISRLGWFSNDLEVASTSELRAASAAEGALSQRLTWHRHRESSLRITALAHARRRHPHGRLVCQVPGCGFDFAAVYGDTGEGYAEVHHRTPLAALAPGTVTTLDDLAVVCSNCHRMIHRGGESRPIESLIVRPRAV